MKKNAIVLSMAVGMALASSVVIGRTLSEKSGKMPEAEFSSLLLATGQDTIGMVSSTQEQPVEFLLQEEEVPENIETVAEKGSVRKEEKVRKSKGVTPDRIFKRFKREPGAIHMRIPKFLLSIGSKAIAEDGDMDEEDKMAVDLINNIDHMRILVLEDCSKKVQRNFIRMTSHMDIKGFERVMQVKDGEDKVDILIKEGKGVIREALFVIGGSDCVLLHFKGRFRVEDLDRLMKMKD